MGVILDRKEICKAISATNGEAACQERADSDEEKNNVIYVYTLCKKECTPYFKGKKKEIDQKDCGYNKSKIKGGKPEPPPPKPGPDPIVKLIIDFPKEYESICDFIKKELLFDRKQLCAFELFDKQYVTPRCLLCVDICNDKEVIEAEYVPDKTPTKNNAVKAITNKGEKKTKRNLWID